MEGESGEEVGDDLESVTSSSDYVLFLAICPQICNDGWTTQTRLDRQDKFTDSSRYMNTFIRQHGRKTDGENTYTTDSNTVHIQYTNTLGLSINTRFKLG